MHTFTAAITSVALLAISPQSRAADPEVLVLSASEDAGGTTQADLDMQVLKMLERRSVAMLEAKMRDYLRAQGQQTEIPKLDAESHYIVGPAEFNFSTDRWKRRPAAPIAASPDRYAALRQSS